MPNVLILGAGASYSAMNDSLVKKKERVSPPLLKEIFQKAKQLKLLNPTDPIWLEIKKGLGISLDDLLVGNVNFEHILSLLYINSQQVQKDSAIKLPTPFESYLKEILVGLLQVTTGFVRKELCIYHKALAETLKNRDVVINFNYDLIMDFALQETGRWSQESGYVLAFDSGLFSDEKEYEWKTINNKTLESKVYLLKLHGSLNWVSHSVISRIGMAIGRPWSPLGSDEGLLMQQQVEESELRLIPLDKAYDFDINKLRKQVINKYDKEMTLAVLDEFVILPPTFYKEIFQTKLYSIWMKAAKSLNESERITIVGYSFPDADLMFQYIFRTAIASNKAKSIRIEIVNPDPLVADKIKGMVSRPIEVFLYENLSTYVSEMNR